MVLFAILKILLGYGFTLGQLAHLFFHSFDLCLFFRELL